MKKAKIIFKDIQIEKKVYKKPLEKLDLIYQKILFKKKFSFKKNIKK